jgi:hypothetical protein
MQFGGVCSGWLEPHSLRSSTAKGVWEDFGHYDLSSRSLEDVLKGLAPLVLRYHRRIKRESPEQENAAADGAKRLLRLRKP